MTNYSTETTVNVALPKFTRGDYYDFTLPFTNSDGTPYDFTQWDGIQGQMRLGSTEGDSIGVVTWTKGGAVPAGSARVVVQSDVAVNAIGGYLWYDLEGYTTASPIKNKTIVQGRIPIIRDVTRL